MRTWTDAARDDVRAILHAALDAASPQPLLRAIRVEEGTLVLPDGARVRVAGRRVRLLAMGKAAGGMAAHAQRWGPFARALVVAPHEVDLDGFASLVGDHPLPGARSVQAGEATLALARECAADDLLVVLLSGGASAMVELPAVPLADLRRANELLLHADVGIADVNTVRRHLSRLKGGQLLRETRGEVLLLAISDVAGGELATLASGPFAVDPTTFGDALAVLRRHGLLEAMPPSVREHLEAGARGERVETLKPGAPDATRVTARVLADNDTALRAAALAAARRGYETRVLLGFLRGEARRAGEQLAAVALEAARSAAKPVCLLAGGETVVRVEGLGRGGRNQEVALAAVKALAGRDVVLATLATDGVDGPTDAAGALVDALTLGRARALGLDPDAHLAENDAYTFFEALDDLVRTGPTGTNVRDLAIVLVRA